MGLYHHNVNVNLNANSPDGMGLMVEFRYPFEWGNTKNEVYYWDTLLTTKERFPEEADSMESPRGYYAFITIGMESGRITEEHFWIPAFTREDGRLLREEGGGGLMTNVGERVSFNVDSEGNIILARQANDCFGDRCDSCRDGIYQWSTQEGNIVGMRLLVDGGTREHHNVNLNLNANWPDGIAQVTAKYSPDGYCDVNVNLNANFNFNLNVNLNLNANVNLNLNANRPDGMGLYHHNVNVNLNANRPDGMGLYHHNVNVNLNANWPDGMGLYHHNVNVNLNANWPDGMGLTGTLTANAELGDHNIDAGWNSHAYVARYTASTLTLTLTLTSTLTLTLTLTGLTASTNRKRRGVVESTPTQPEVPFT